MNTKKNYSLNSDNRWRSEFPHIFQRTLHIKLDKIGYRSNNKTKRQKSGAIYIETFVRCTRNKKTNIASIDWVRVSNGHYKGDIAKLEYFDEKNACAYLKLFPRINYETSSKRRPLRKPFDPSAIRYF